MSKIFSIFLQFCNVRILSFGHSTLGTLGRGTLLGTTSSMGRSWSRPIKNGPEFNYVGEETDKPLGGNTRTF